ncbi:MAG: hypothetical protein HOA17_06265 [Candidatus Melainabacteria bacterium]|jgi:UDP-3-O-[3-hydroxymyristoyl] N-acetylglucosamine deacetylase|nr:hypothetical protein [Candidatus Melainabacteria bacterium]
MVNNTQYYIKDNELESKGIISRELIKAVITANDANGLRFLLNNVLIEAHIDNLHSTQRNTVLAKAGECLCLTEHFLAAASIYGLDNFDLSISESELPFGDGSAKLWIDFFKQAGLRQGDRGIQYHLEQEYRIVDENDDSRYIVLKPSPDFKLTYCLDWKHPKIGKQEYTWSIDESIDDIATARTFSNEEENKMLGLSGWVIGLTEDDFTHDLHQANEPARHKALDLIGDLRLSGMNPVKIAMHVTSHKGGHELNSRAAKLLQEVCCAK